MNRPRLVELFGQQFRCSSKYAALSDVKMKRLLKKVLAARPRPARKEP